MVETFVSSKSLLRKNFFRSFQLAAKLSGFEGKQTSSFEALRAVTLRRQLLWLMFLLLFRKAKSSLRCRDNISDAHLAILFPFVLNSILFITLKVSGKCACVSERLGEWCGELVIPCYTTLFIGICIWIVVILTVPIADMRIAPRIWRSTLHFLAIFMKYNFASLYSRILFFPAQTGIGCGITRGGRPHKPRSSRSSDVRWFSAVHYVD